MFKKLKEKWELKSTKQLVLVLITFALTGTTIAVVKKPLLKHLFEDQIPLAFSIAYWILILPIYNIVLLIYGSLLGQFDFFWQREKKMFNRIFKKKNDQ